jgi:hypothetical protein
MEIEDAFTAEEIGRTDTNVEGEEEAQLRAMFKQVSSSTELSPEDVAVLFFVAGRAHQADLDTINVPMTPVMVQRFLQYLSEG